MNHLYDVQEAGDVNSFGGGESPLLQTQIISANIFLWVVFGGGPLCVKKNFLDSLFYLIGRNN
jgi:hypothetical protein